MSTGCSVCVCGDRGLIGENLKNEKENCIQRFLSLSLSSLYTFNIEFASLEFRHGKKCQISADRHTNIIIYSDWKTAGAAFHLHKYD